MLHCERLVSVAEGEARVGYGSTGVAAHHILCLSVQGLWPLKLVLTRRHGHLHRLDGDGAAAIDEQDPQTTQLRMVSWRGLQSGKSMGATDVAKLLYLGPAFWHGGFWWVQRYCQNIF